MKTAIKKSIALLCSVFVLLDNLFFVSAAHALAPESIFRTPDQSKFPAAADFGKEQLVAKAPTFWPEGSIPKEGSIYFPDSWLMLNPKDPGASPLLDFVSHFMEAMIEYDPRATPESFLVLQNQLTSALFHRNRLRVRTGLIFGWRLKKDGLEVFIQDECKSVIVPGIKSSSQDEDTPNFFQGDDEWIEFWQTRALWDASGKLIGNRIFTKILFNKFHWEPFLVRESALEEYLKSPGWLSLPLWVKTRRLKTFPQYLNLPIVQREKAIVDQLEALDAHIARMNDVEARRIIHKAIFDYRRPELLRLLDNQYRKSRTLDERNQCLDIFAFMNSGFATDPLIQLFQGEQNQAIKQKTLRLLGGLRDQAVVYQALPLLDSDNDAFAFEALVAITHVGGPVAVEAAKKMLMHRNPQINAMAHEALIYLGVEKMPEPKEEYCPLRELLVSRKNWKFLDIPSDIDSSGVSFSEGIYLTDSRKWIDLFDAIQWIQLFEGETKYFKLIKLLKEELSTIPGIDLHAVAFVLIGAIKNAFVHGNRLEWGKGMGLKAKVLQDKIVLYVYDEGKGDLTKPPVSGAPFLMATSFAGDNFHLRKIRAMGGDTILSTVHDAHGDRIGTLATYIIPLQATMLASISGLETTPVYTVRLLGKAALEKLEELKTIAPQLKIRNFSGIESYTPQTALKEFQNPSIHPETGLAVEYCLEKCGDNWSLFPELEAGAGKYAHIPLLGPDEIAVTKEGLKKGFDWMSGPKAKAARNKLPSVEEDPRSEIPYDVNGKKLTFYKRRDEQGPPFWAFKKADLDLAGIFFGLDPIGKISQLGSHDVPVSKRGLGEKFFGDDRLLAKKVKMLPDPEDSKLKDVFEIERGRVKFFKRRSGRYVQWVFAESDVEKAGKYFGLEPRTPIEELRSDEIAVSRPALEGVFAGTVRDIAKEMNERLDKAYQEKLKIDKETSNEVMVEGARFIKRRSGGNFVWSFKSTDQRKVAQIFDVECLADFSELGAGEIRVTFGRLTAAGLTDTPRMETIVQDLIAEVHDKKLPETVIKGTGFLRRRIDNAIVCAIKVSDLHAAVNMLLFQYIGELVVEKEIRQKALRMALPRFWIGNQHLNSQDVEVLMGMQGKILESIRWLVDKGNIKNQSGDFVLDKNECMRLVVQSNRDDLCRDALTAANPVPAVSAVPPKAVSILPPAREPSYTAEFRDIKDFVAKAIGIPDKVATVSDSFPARKSMTIEEREGAILETLKSMIEKRDNPYIPTESEFLAEMDPSLTRLALLFYAYEWRKKGHLAENNVLLYYEVYWQESLRPVVRIFQEIYGVRPNKLELCTVLLGGMDVNFYRYFEREERKGTAPMLDASTGIRDLSPRKCILENQAVTPKLLPRYAVDEELLHSEAKKLQATLLDAARTENKKGQKLALSAVLNTPEFERMGPVTSLMLLVDLVQAKKLSQDSYTMDVPHLAPEYSLILVWESFRYLYNRPPSVNELAVLYGYDREIMQAMVNAIAEISIVGYQPAPSEKSGFPKKIHPLLTLREELTAKEKALVETTQDAFSILHRLSAKARNRNQKKEQPISPDTQETIGSDETVEAAA